MILSVMVLGMSLRVKVGEFNVFSTIYFNDFSDGTVEPLSKRSI